MKQKKTAEQRVSICFVCVFAWVRDLDILYLRVAWVYKSLNTIKNWGTSWPVQRGRERNQMIQDRLLYSLVLQSGRRQEERERKFNLICPLWFNCYTMKGVNVRGKEGGEWGRHEGMSTQGGRGEKTDWDQDNESLKARCGKLHIFLL